MNNYNHNLIHQLSESLDSAWRCARYYIRDAEEAGCGTCIELWKEFEMELNKLIDKIKAEMEKHIKEGRIN